MLVVDKIKKLESMRGAIKALESEVQTYTEELGEQLGPGFHQTPDGLMLRVTREKADWVIEFVALQRISS